MIRFDARGAYLLFGRRGDSAYLKQGGNQGRARTAFFLRTSRTCETKL